MGAGPADEVGPERDKEEILCPDDAPLLQGLVSGRLRNGTACVHFDMREGEAVRLELDQIDADLSISLRGPTGKGLATYDTPVGMEAPERPCFLASTRGRHSLHVRSFGAPDARYSLRLLLQRPATAEDRACGEATRKFVEANTAILEGGVSPSMARQLEVAADLWSLSEEALSEAMARREAAWALESLGQFRRAEAQIRKALAPAKEAKSSYLELSAHNWLGIILLDRAQVEEAAKSFERALAGARAVGDRRAEASAINNLALISESRGNVPQAIEFLREAAAIQRQLPFPGDLARTFENLATNLALQDHHQEALDLLDDALELAQQHGFTDIEAHCNLDIGWVHRLRGQPERALAPMRRALQLWRTIGDLPGQAGALDRLGTVLAESGDTTGAFQALQESLEISNGIEAPMLAVPTQANLACLHQEVGNFEQSRRLLRQLRRGSWHFLDAKGKSHVHYCAALLEEKTGNLSEALKQIEDALEIVETIKSLSRREGARHRPIWLWQDYAELRVRLLTELARTTGQKDFLRRALSAADHARARSLSEMVHEPRLSGENFEEEERRLQNHLQLLGESRRHLLAIDGPEEELNELEREISTVVLELEVIHARRRAGGLPSSLTGTAPISLPQVQEHLAPGTVLLRYFLTPTETFLFAVTADSLEVYRLAGRKALEAQAETLHQALQASALNPIQAELQSRSMSQALLPIGILGAEADSLIVVADGGLHYVPFATLPMPAPTSGAEIAAPLIDRMEVRYLPSIGVGLALTQRARARPKASREVAVFADPVYSRSDPRLLEGSFNPQEEEPAGPSFQTAGDFALSLLMEDLPRLEATANEAEAILSWFAPTEHYAALGFEASKEALLDLHMADYRILHLATHAFVDERFPELSGLAFSRYRSNGEAIAGEVYLHELPLLHLNADLAVLSGCQTALGRKVRGDGLLGLTRGFFQAGSSQVLVSLWSVDDRATAALMAEFYRSLMANGHDAAAALRDAQRWMRSQKQWHEPYYWAPFVLQGVDPAH